MRQLKGYNKAQNLRGKFFLKLLSPSRPQNTDTHTQTFFSIVEERKMRPINRYNPLTEFLIFGLISD